MTNRKGTILAVLVVLMAAVTRIDGQEIWTPEAFENTGIYSLAVGPAGTRYAGTFEGLYRSTDPGIWTLLPDSPIQATTIALDPSDPDTLYTGSYLYREWGLHKSSDGGQHFEKLGTYPVGVRSIAIDPADPATIYVGGDHPLVYKSSDAGATFSAPLTPALVSRIAALVIDPTRPGTVYAGSDLGEVSSYYYYDYYYPPNAPVMRSVDSGLRWFAALEQYVHSPEPAYATALAVDSRSGTLYAGTIGDPGNTSLFRSSDGGNQWDRFVIGNAALVGSIQTLVVDPSRTNTLYAATTGAGVLRSEDGGATWVEMNEGLSGVSVTSLVLDSANGHLLAASGQQIFRIRLDPRPSTCTTTRNRLCLLEGRYEVIVNATNPRSGLGSPGVAIPGSDRFGSFSLPGLTGDPSLPEVFVKLVDSPPGPPVLVFYGGLTSLPYSLLVTDTATGQTETYRNDSGNRMCGGVDGAAFFSDSFFDVLSTGAESRAAAEGGTLSLLSSRFSITLSAFSSRHGRTEQGVGVSKTDRYGYFSLPGFTGDASFPEVFVKMIDFRTITGDFVLFHTGLTSLDYILAVTDQVTGEVRTFENPGLYCGGVEVLHGTN